MRGKIRLKLDALTVDTFATEAAAAKGGTVYAMDATSLAEPCLPPRTSLQTCARGLTCTDIYHVCIC
jgi:hypothetical protein